ncbi:MAG: type IV secretion system protein, partial [Sphingomonadales bacterium]|nr:type IV secretion system protein [Sphingomonadales bacterium]
RFVTIRTDPGGQSQEPRPWQAVVNWKFNGASMSAADRMRNPLGFQVTRYRRDAEVPLDVPAQTTVSVVRSGTLPAQAVALPATTVSSGPSSVASAARKSQ